MGELILSLTPVALGVILSPLAIMALVAVLLSRRARVNGLAYLAGWVIGLGGVMAVSLWVFTQFAVHQFVDPPLWVPLVRLALGLFFGAAAVWVFRRGRAPVVQMAAARNPHGVVAAAPQLPAWLRTVESFRPVRTFFLGLALFVLNPVDASCAVIAALDITSADIEESDALWVAASFVVIGALPIAIPVAVVVIRGDDAEPVLARMRVWIAGNTHVLNAALLLVIGVLQLQKGIAALL